MRPGVFRSFLSATVALLLVVCLTGCASNTKADKKEFMFWPAAPDAPHVQFLVSISSSADITKRQDKFSDLIYGQDPTGDLPFERPYGIRMYDGKLFVCDTTSANVSILDFRKREVRVIGRTGQINLLKPIDIAVAPDGTKYVADTGHGAVLVYDAADGYAGRVAIPNLRPVSVAVRDDLLYVSDMTAGRVRVFNRFNGKEIRSIGEAGKGDGKLGGPMGLAIDGQGNIFVNDILGCRVQKFSPDGKFISALGGLGDHPGEFVRPKLMAIDSSGILYVVDNAFQNVQMFNDKGEMLMFFGGHGAHPGSMDMPTGICVSDTDLDLFAPYVHPAFEIKRLLIVTNNTGPNKINIYALGELKPGKTIADLTSSRVQGVFGFSTGTPAGETLQLPSDAATEPGTTQPSATQPASTQQDSTAPPSPPVSTQPAATVPSREGVPF